MVFCGESIITEISVYVFFYMSEFIIQSTLFEEGKKKIKKYLHYSRRCSILIKSAVLPRSRKHF